MYQHRDLTDEAFVRAVEDASLPASAFDHRAHVRLAFLYLCEASFGAAGDRFVTTLVRFAAANGAGAKFHATITWAYVALVNERLAAARDASFDAFAAANPDLLDHRGGAFARLYDAETIASERARRVFVLPRVRRDDSARP